MEKKFESFDTSSKNFLENMEHLVSNDKTIRENAVPKIKEYLKKSYNNSIELYEKISRSLFYFFWNTDKPNYQLSMAKLISSLIYLNENKILIPNHEIWIHTLLTEFGRKFKSIDVLRLDKYIMLCDHIMSTYLVSCLENNLYNPITNLINYFSEEIKNNPNSFNFSFESNKIKIVNRFIKTLLDKNIDIKNKQDYINNKEEGFMNFYKSLLRLYLSINDKREIEYFNKNIFEDLLNSVSDIKNDNISLVKDIKKDSEKFLEDNKDILIKLKLDEIDYFVNKLRDEKYIKKEKRKNDVIDPVNDYIMNKKYKQKFRKSKTEIKKEKINKDKKEKKEKKEKNLNKNKKEIKNNKEIINDIDFDNIKIEKEIINLDDNITEEKQNEKAEIKNEGIESILNKKTKRNKKDKK